MLPVADEKTFLDFLERLDITAEKQQGGVYKLKSELIKLPVYFRLANKYAYLAFPSAESLAKEKLLAPKRIDPGDDFLSLSVRIDQVPETARAIALNVVRTPLENAESEDKPGESAADKAFRVQLLKDLQERVARVLNQGEELQVGVEINQSAKKFSVTASLSGKAKSQLSADIAALAKGTSLFAQMSGDKSVLAGRVHFTLPEKVRKTLEPVVDQGIAKALAKEADADRKAVVKRFLETLKPSLVAGELDAALSVRGATGKGFSVVAGVKLKKGEDLDKVLREAVGLLPAEIQERIKFGAATEDGTKIHRLDLQEGYDAGARAAFGDNPIYLALRSDALLVGLGEGGLEAVKAAVRTKPGAAPPLSFEVELGRLLSVAPKDEAANKAAEKAFGKGSPGQIRVSLEGGKALQLRLVTQLSVVEFFGELARLKTMKEEQ
jgi:hypothetical protein